MIPDFNNMIPELHYYIHRKCTPNWKIDANVIPFIDITYVIDGKAEYNIGGHIYIVKKGDLICIPQNTYRAAVNIPEDLMECYSTNIFLRDQFGQEAAFPRNPRGMAAEGFWIYAEDTRNFMPHPVSDIQPDPE